MEEYTVVAAKNPTVLCEKVNTKMEQGYSLVGGIATTSAMFVQAMVGAEQVPLVEMKDPPLKKVTKKTTAKKDSSDG